MKLTSVERIGRSQLIPGVRRTIRDVMMTRFATAIVALVACAGCSDVREERFPTVGEAAAQGMVARGWIPAGLPATGTDVVVRSNIDTNMVRGRLSLPPGELFVAGKNLRVVLDDQTLPFYGRFRPEWWPDELNPPGRASKMQSQGWDLFVVYGERSTYVAVHRSKRELYFWGEGS
jgi:hypothetical protein